MFGQTSNLGVEQSRGILATDGKWDLFSHVAQGQEKRGLRIQETCGSQTHSVPRGR